MKKNKFFKSLVTIVMSAVSAFAVAAAGCGGGHTHSWGDYISDGASGHHRECTENDGGKTDVEKHVYDKIGRAHV